MARTIIRNISGQTLTLPLPYHGVLQGGAATVVAEDEATVIAYLGGNDLIGYIWDVFPVNENELVGPIVLEDGARSVIRALAAAPSPVAVNGQKVTGLGAPSAASDAATKAYVDAQVGGTVTLSGDVTGLSTATVVEAIQGQPVSALTPATDDVWLYDGSEWVPYPKSSLVADVYPKRPDAWGNEYLWWKLDDAPQSGSNANTVVNSGSAGAATLTGGTDTFYEKVPALGIPQLFQLGARSRPATPAAPFEGANAVIPAAGSQLTVSVWARLWGDTSLNIVQKLRDVAGVNTTVRIFTTGRRAYFIIYTATSGQVQALTPEFDAPVSADLMLSLTYDGSTLRGFVNGVERASAAAAGNLDWNPAAPGAWRIGSDSTGGASGDIWDVRMALTVRTPADLLADYKRGAGYSY